MDTITGMGSAAAAEIDRIMRESMKVEKRCAPVEPEGFETKRRRLH